jgi:hypothetical protein
MLPKEYVDQVGHDIVEARKRPAKSRKPEVPDEAIDTCEDSHEAGSGSNVKTSLEHFDDGGVMALVCRHDIPLFLANIDTPGEQQKYAFALIKHLFSLIPPSATVKVLYDVGCVVDRSRALVREYSSSISSIHADNFVSMPSLRMRYPPGCHLLRASCTRMLMNSPVKLCTTHDIHQAPGFLMGKERKGCGLDSQV